MMALAPAGLTRIFNDCKKIRPGRGIKSWLLTKHYNRAMQIAIEPGKYTVILEPAAAGDLIGFDVFWTECP